ncbi:MAG: hypothetical protein LKM38_07695 [Pseudomonas veronii]|nr:hypothetical protein [Pseudomonas veronii]
MPGIRLYLQPVQDLTIEDRVSRTQYQFLLSSTRCRGCWTWDPKLVERLRSVAAAGRRGQRPAGQGPAGLPESTAMRPARLGVTWRRSTPRCTTPLASA